MKSQIARPSFYVLFAILFFSLSETVIAQGVWVIFCDQCTSLKDNTYLDLSFAPSAVYLFDDKGENRKLLSTVQDFERGLKPDDLSQSTIIPEIIGYGSTSVGFRIPGIEHLLIRRLPGFADYERARNHIFLINQYRSKLHRLFIKTTITQLIALEDTKGYGIVYVIQPFLKNNQLSKNAFSKYGDKFKKQLLKKQIDIAKRVIHHNIYKPEEAITIDIVNNNWEIFDFNPQTMEFDVRLNDIAQPLFKENNQLTYDFYDQAFSIIFPIDWAFVRSEMQKEFGELFEPRNLMMQALWGYDEAQPASSCEDNSEVRAYPDWAMNMVNSVLSDFNYTNITSQEALAAHHQDKDALGCLDLYRAASHSIRRTLGLNSNVYMTPDKTLKEMYFNENPRGYGSCLWGVAKDLVAELIHGSPK